MFNNPALRVLIAEDSAILRDGLSALLTRRGCEAEAVADGEQLLAKLAELGEPGFCDSAQNDETRRLSLPKPKGGLPDVVVCDIRMPPTFTDEGLRAAIEARRRYPELPVLLFSQYVEAAYASALLAGNSKAIGYLLKDRVADVADFIAALYRVANGETVLDPEVVTQLARAHGPTNKLERLTPREREVLELMAEGRSNSAIADKLYLSNGAVEKNVAAIFTKLDLPVTTADNRRVLAVRVFLGL